MEYISSDRYEGEWQKDLFHGFGTYTWGTSVSLDKDNKQVLVVGRKYEGDWSEGKKHGLG